MAGPLHRWLRVSSWVKKAERERSKETKGTELVAESFLLESQNYRIVEPPGTDMAKFAPGSA